MTYKIDTICLIDRYRHSPTRGEQMAEAVLMFKKIKPGVPEATNLGGALPHGAEVTILDKRLKGGVLWVKCTGMSEKDAQGIARRQTGWVIATQLDQLGSTRPGIKATE